MRMSTAKRRDATCALGGGWVGAFQSPGHLWCGCAQREEEQGLGFRVWGFGFRVSGLGFRVQGLGYLEVHLGS